MTLSNNNSNQVLVIVYRELLHLNLTNSEIRVSVLEERVPSSLNKKLIVKLLINRKCLLFNCVSY